ncbi:bifunctional metallophosphatase/5'-nucleotidase [Paenibacillus sp. GM2]|uniref:bifunctional metallophosphatase/5'-nucleotidase n=1 Tax=Paenibacillus sp. GM2 TaxID=1622070 RepID=UPI0008399475|nr:bifunctional UDP-sugar hydrolase/5'-nucleotidase [Paenibacillus sp. GM2]
MPDKDEVTLTIAYTNDLHSHFGAMGRIAAMIDDLRSEPNSEMLLLDIGDHMDRAAPETEGTMGQANVDILNLTGYDAITIGNNEGLTFTPELLTETYARLRCPVICNNIVEQRTGQPPGWMRRHHIVQRGPFTIGLIGATAAFSNFYSLLGWDALDPLETIQYDVEQLRPRVDLIIVMSHLGILLDRQLAETIPDIDLIIGGHTHHLLEEPLIIGKTAITAAGKFGNYVGLIKYRKNPLSGLPEIYDGKVLQVEPGVESEGVLSSIDIYRKKAKARLDRTVTTTDRKLLISYHSESSFGNLLAQAVRRFTNSELAIVNSGQLLSDLPAGDISEGMLHERCPSPINPCTMILKGEDILYTLEQSLLPEMMDKTIFGYGFRGKVLGGICLDGMEVEYDPYAAPYRRVTKASVAGIPLNPSATYKVGTLDMFTFGVGYEQLQHGSEQKFMLPLFIRDLLRLELQTAGAVDSCFFARWKQV